MRCRFAPCRTSGRTSDVKVRRYTDSVVASIAARLRAERERLSLTQREMAARSGIPFDTYTKYEGGSRKLTANPLAKLKNAGIEIGRLFGGDDELALLKTHSANLAQQLQARAEQPRAGYVYLPLYDVRAAAGGGELVENEDVVDVLAFKESWIRQELHVAPTDLRLIHVVGDSMEPDLRAGDIILIDHTDSAARREGIYVVRMEDAILVKQLQRLPGGVVRVISRNQAYEPFTVPTSALNAPAGFAVIGRVVWACRRL